VRKVCVRSEKRKNVRRLELHLRQSLTFSPCHRRSLDRRVLLLDRRFDFILPFPSLYDLRERYARMALVRVGRVRSGVGGGVIGDDGRRRLDIIGGG
jgi:hypothetical protein